MASRANSGASASPHQEVLDAVTDPFARRAMRVAYHLRRYALIYVVGGLAALTIGLLPTVGTNASVSANGGASNGGAYGAGTGVTGGPDAGGITGAAGAAGGAGSGAGSGAAGGAGGAGGAGTGSSGGGSQKVHVGSGITRAGYKCSPGTHQLPFSQYAAPCVAKFTGNNGGATWNGVTANKITIAMRHTSDSTGANAAAVNAEATAAGGVTPATAESYLNKLIPYFNKTFELYGRQVQLVDYNGQGNGNNEQLGQDQAAACADADTAANSKHAFEDLQWNGFYEYEPFAVCAPRYKLVVPFGALYYPESTYQKADPYVWSVTTSCTLGGQELAEFVGKQLAPYPAKWAGSDGALSMKNTQRKFAIYVPSNAGYQQCTNTFKSTLEQKYGVASNRFDQYNYALDISQAGTDSNRAAIQFASNHDTSIVLSSDPIAPTFLSQACKKQNYFPEWVVTGVALTDQDNWAQLWDQQEMSGRLFGISQLGSTQAALDPHGEAAIALKAAGIPLNAGSVYVYYTILPIFNQLQAAGPLLTPANIKAGTQSLPVLGGQSGADGTWHYGNTHTAIIDSREIYWNANKTSPANGKPGTYIPIFGGRRFQVGQYPTGSPPFFR